MLKKISNLISLPTLIFTILAGSSAGAGAEEFSSSYTKIKFDDCTIVSTYELGASWACPGYKGYPLFVAEDDLRLFVSFGFGAPGEMAASQTLPAFNNIGETLEWRLKKQNGNLLPFAAILRWFPEYPKETGEGYDKGDVLVVTKIENGNTCHIAYINAKIVPDANVLARQIADMVSPKFNCETDNPLRVPPANRQGAN